MMIQLPPIYERSELVSYINSRSQTIPPHPCIRDPSNNIDIACDTPIIELTPAQKTSVRTAKVRYRLCGPFRAKLLVHEASRTPIPDIISLEGGGVIDTSELRDKDNDDLKYRCTLSQDFPDDPVGWGGPDTPAFEKIYVLSLRYHMRICPTCKKGGQCIPNSLPLSSIALVP